MEQRQAMLEDLSEEAFRAWRHHPVTRAVRLFLTDYGASIEQRMLGRWRAGTITLAQEHEARGRAALAAEMAELQWAAMRAFYGEGTEETEGRDA
ncbi:hypothetical protein AA12717_2476 [Gluconacetobacter sacchari DSM 12717]|uniref:Uncharacterized protein n=2 Tax=Gluconacetobacter sacchari TaxID=92759 RepID=A0A7W4IAE5_9PROT|nr:hypothetical protein [Gluconacetobacter sacchari]MBB2159256.1 hypothetical protein [Gluconacetobacter sacchari]GBQ26804.1 hypothetical protein AA12717_2476 [Gluconacetobacter sacchari DSM 12717]